MADDRIEIEIVLDDGSVVKGFQKINTEAKKSAQSIGADFTESIANISRSVGRSLGLVSRGNFGKDLSKALQDVRRNAEGLATSFLSVANILSARFVRTASNALDAVKASVFNLRSAFLGLIATVGAISFLRNITQAASEQEDAVNALNTSLQTAGTFSEEASQSFQDFASSLQRVSTFGDEAILQQAALARNFARSNEEAQKLTTAAVELSAAAGISLDSAITNLGKTFAGLAGEIGESVPAIRNLTTEQLKSGAALDLVIERFGGSALAQTRTFSGALQQLSNTFGDLLERLGQQITESPVVINLFRALSDTLVTVASGLSASSFNLNEFLKSAVINTAAAVNAIIDVFSTLLQLPNALRFAFKTIELELAKSLQLFLVTIQPLAGLLDRVFGSAGESAEQIEKNFAVIQKLNDELKVLAERNLETDRSFDQARASLDLFIARFQELNTTTVTPQIQPQTGGAGATIDKDLEELRRKVLELRTETRTAIEDAFFNPATVDTPTEAQILAARTEKDLKALQQGLNQTKIKTQQQSAAIGAAVNNGIGNSIVNAVGAAVNALAAGENAFSAFGKAALATIGDLAVQLGQTLILSGIGIESLKTLGGAAAIAAGIGLVAIGTLLKTAAGGATSNVGGGQSSISPALNDLQPGGIDAGDLNGPNQTATVVIEGNVFDSETTGLRIAEILKEEGFNNAVVS